MSAAGWADALIVILAIIGAGTVVGFALGFTLGAAAYFRAHKGDEIECTADGVMFRGASGPLRMWVHDLTSGPARRAAHRRARAEWRAQLGLPRR